MAADGKERESRPWILVVAFRGDFALEKGSFESRIEVHAPSEVSRKSFLRCGEALVNVFRDASPEVMDELAKQLQSTPVSRG